MKYLIVCFALLFQLTANAQVRGNKDIITKTFDLATFTSIEVELIAEVFVDCAANEERITITTDANLIDLIERKVVDGHLELVQKKWIEPSQGIKITIGAPRLEDIKHGVHETTVVKNIKRSTFRGEAEIGVLKLFGEVEQFIAAGKNGELDATQLMAEEVKVNLLNYGKIKLAAPAKITGVIKEEGEVTYLGNETIVNVETERGGRIRKPNEPKATDELDTRFIKFKLKNNSIGWINCYVKGPKPNGSYFSYGFRMFPGQVRKKNWTIGTKVYRETAFGNKKLLGEVRASDEGKVMKLYRKEE